MSWALLALISYHAKGRMMELQAIAAPTTGFEGHGGRKYVSGAPLIAVHAKNARPGTMFSCDLGKFLI